MIEVKEKREGESEEIVVRERERKEWQREVTKGGGEGNKKDENAGGE